jgi:hypothetical protein
LSCQNGRFFAGLFLGLSLLLCFVFPTFAVNSYSTALKGGESASYTLYYKSYVLGSQMLILGVSGTRVTANFQGYPQFGITIGTIQLDIFSGLTNSSISSLFFAVGSGLNTGDPIFDSYPVSITAQRSYTCGAGGQTRQQVYTRFPSSDQSQSVQISWDQSTGLMCNYQANYVSNNTVALGLILAGTSVWGSSSSALDPFVYGQVLPSLFGLVLVVLVLLVYFRRRKRRGGRSRAKQQT